MCRFFISYIKPCKIRYIPSLLLKHKFKFSPYCFCNLPNLRCVQFKPTKSKYDVLLNLGLKRKTVTNPIDVSPGRQSLKMIVFDPQSNTCLTRVTRLECFPKQTQTSLTSPLHGTTPKTVINCYSHGQTKDEKSLPFLFMVCKHCHKTEPLSNLNKLLEPLIIYSGCPFLRQDRISQARPEFLPQAWKSPQSRRNPTRIADDI